MRSTTSGPILGVATIWVAKWLQAVAPLAEAFSDARASILAPAFTAPSVWVARLWKGQPLSLSPILGLTLDPDTGSFGEADRLLERVNQEQLALASVPRIAQSGRAEVEVGTNLLKERPQVDAQFAHGRTSPVPIAVVDTKDP